MLLTVFSAFADFEDFPKAAKQKEAVHLCFASDEYVRKSCQMPKERLQACGHEVHQLVLPGVLAPGEAPTAEMAIGKTKEFLKSVGVSDTAPIFVEGHGFGEREHTLVVSNAFAAAAPDGVKSADLINLVRKQFQTNPIWMSACHSGTCSTLGDRCLGMSCESYQRSKVNNDGMETTLASIIELMCQDEKFRTVDKNGNGSIDNKELTSHFCNTLGENRFAKKFHFYSRTDLEPQTKEEAQQFIDEQRKKYGASAVTVTPFIRPRLVGTFSDGTESSTIMPPIKDLVEAEKWAADRYVGWPASCDRFIVNGNFVTQLWTNTKGKREKPVKCRMECRVSPERRHHSLT